MRVNNSNLIIFTWRHWKIGKFGMIFIYLFNIYISDGTLSFFLFLFYFNFNIVYLFIYLFHSFIYFIYFILLLFLLLYSFLFHLSILSLYFFFPVKLLNICMIIKQIMFYSKAEPYMEELSHIWRSYLNMVKHKPNKEVPKTMLKRHVPNKEVPKTMLMRWNC